jgi:hypothetical protein
MNSSMDFGAVGIFNDIVQPLINNDTIMVCFGGASFIIFVVLVVTVLSIKKIKVIDLLRCE